MIVYACSDLMFASKIAATARALGWSCRPVRDAAALQRRLDRVDDGKGCDAVTGAAVDLALGPAALAMVRQIKAHGGTPAAGGGTGAGGAAPASDAATAPLNSPGAGSPVSIPVVAFGGHLDAESLQAARAAGADFVMTNGQFAANLESVLARLAQG